MSGKCWKQAAAAVLVAAAVAACGATAKREGPVFATAAPVAAAKPDEFGFKHAIRVSGMEGLTEKIKRNLVVILQADDFSQSLRRSLASDEMLAPNDAEAVYDLTPEFVDLRTAPVNDEMTAAQAIFRYRVERREDGMVIFDKQIKTEFTSVADPAFEKGGMFSRTLRMVGFTAPDPGPVVANRPGAENRAPGPERDSAREVHAARNAVALNVRTAMRHLVAASPERFSAPVAVDPVPAADEAGKLEGIDEEEDETAVEAEPAMPESDGNPLPPLAPEVDSEG